MELCPPIVRNITSNAQQKKNAAGVLPFSLYCCNFENMCVANVVGVYCCGPTRQSGLGPRLVYRDRQGFIRIALCVVARL